MTDGLKVTVGPNEFSSRTTDEKLDLIYKAVTSQQTMCIDTVDVFNRNCTKYDKFIENSTKSPKQNKKVAVGIGAGSGAVGGFSASELIDFIKSYFFGG